MRSCIHLLAGKRFVFFFLYMSKMRNNLFPVIFFLVPNLLLAQTSFKKINTGKVFSPRITTVFHKLGDDFIRIRTYQYGEAKEPFFVSLHDDEVTAVQGTIKLLEKSGGTLIKIENNKTRNIRFKMKGKYYTCDPNRIFSRVGIIQTLSMFGKIDEKAIDEVDKFAGRLLQMFPDSSSCIISLHNNSNGKFSVTSYLPGNDRSKDAIAVHSVKDEDPDDIFFTTDSILFKNLAREKYNTILQDNVNAKKDGSLSIYCGEKNIRYLNCETEHGKLNQYYEMIATATIHILQAEKQKINVKPPEKKEPPPATSTISYYYKLDTSLNTLSKGDKIYFGEKEVGTISRINDNETSGEIEMTKDFPLYNNMDFYIFSAPDGKPKIELRIDPTRLKALHDAAKATIVMKVML